jgi:hypothetical protein
MDSKPSDNPEKGSKLKRKPASKVNIPGRANKPLLNRMGNSQISLGFEDLGKILDMLYQEIYFLSPKISVSFMPTREPSITWVIPWRKLWE